MSLVDRTRLAAAPTKNQGSRLNLKLGLGSTLDMIHNRGSQLQQQFEESRKFNFNEKYVRGDKLGEG